MNKKLFLGIGVFIIFIGVGVYFYLEFNKKLSLKQVSSIDSEQIKISGEISCLPKIGISQERQETMECVIGLKGKDGRYYGFKNLFEIDSNSNFSETGLFVEVLGRFYSERMKGSDGDEYDVIGVIEISSIKKIEKTSKNDCKISGCNSEVCSEQEIMSNCVWKDEYTCFRFARCERQKNNHCGWTMTEEAKKCLKKTRSNL